MNFQDSSCGKKRQKNTGEKPYPANAVAVGNNDKLILEVSAFLLITK